MKEYTMELMDWKSIEQGAEDTIRAAVRETVIAKILYFEAVRHIKLLGGKTNEQEDAEAAKQRKETKPAKAA